MLLSVVAVITMKVPLTCLLLWPMTPVFGLAAPKFLLKSRSLTSLETASGVKVNRPLPKTKKSKEEASQLTLVQPRTTTTPRPKLLSSVFVDNRNYDEEYWYHPQIHTLGNAGIFGAIHAALAPLSTYIIDNVAYNGVDIRLKVSAVMSAGYASCETALAPCSHRICISVFATIRWPKNYEI